MTYNRHFCATMLDHYQHLLKSAESEEQEVIIRRNIRLYQTQLKQHDRKNHIMRNPSYNADLLVHVNPAPEGLTEAERKAHQLLSQVNRDTILGAGIGVAITAGTVSKFRQLIRELLEQMRDCPEGVLRMLGEETCEALINLSTFSCIYTVRRDGLGVYPGPLKNSFERAKAKQMVKRLAARAIIYVAIRSKTSLVT